MKRWTGMTALALCLTACASWPRVDCGPGHTSAEYYLAQIDVLAGAKAGDLKTDILNASRDCRMNRHGHGRHDETACQHVRAALLQARGGQWRACLDLLRHAGQSAQAGAVRANVNEQWPLYGTPPAFQLLEETSNLANGQVPGNPGAGNYTDQINQKIARCSLPPVCNGYRYHTLPAGANRDNQYHYQDVTDARDAAVGMRWDVCSQELEHMIGDKH